MIDPEMVALWNLRQATDYTPRKFKEAYVRLGSAIQVLNEYRQSIPEAECLLLSPEEVNLKIENYSAQGIGLLPFTSEDYPKLLKDIIDPPLFLFFRGDPSFLNRGAIGLVGSRHASLYGMQTARKIALDAAGSGLVVVSGLAKGIDAAAHEGALEGGITVAVLGCGVDIVYPKANKKLYDRICAQGLVISELEPGTEPRPFYFPLRNRIISGLSVGVVVVEAFQRSGALITAYQALEQGREVFAVPGRVDQLAARGCHQLIRHGAVLTESFLDIEKAIVTQFEMPFMQADESQSEGESLVDATEEKFEQSQILKLIAEGSQTRVSNLEEKNGMAPAKLRIHLTLLELQGKIRKEIDGNYKIR